jgi:uncharacterized protein YjdB
MSSSRAEVRLVRGTCMSARRFAGPFLAVVAGMLWLTDCSDHPVGLQSAGPPPPPSGLFVSGPVRAPSPATRLSSARAPSNAALATSSATVAYVSLSPGTVAGASSAVLRRVGDAASVTTAAVNGGFDPVPVAAQAGDSVDVRVTDAGGSVLLQRRVAILAAAAPYVVRSSPPKLKRDVPLNSRILVVFSEPVAGATVTPTSLYLAQGTTHVPGTAGLLQGSATGVVFTPAASLASNTDYQLIVTQGIRDLNGNALPAAASLNFTTGTTMQGPVASVRIFPDSIGMQVGSQVQLIAVARDSQGTLLEGFSTSWSSGNDSVVSVSTTGLATGLAPGYTFITATAEGQIGATTISVSAVLVPIGYVTVTPESTRIAIGDSLVLSVDMRDTAGQSVSPPRPIAWSSSNPAVATVAPSYSRTGLVRGIANGIVQIVATVESKSDTAFVAVGPPGAIVGLVLSPDTISTVLRASVQLSAFARDDQGFLTRVDSTQVAWVSSDTTVATVSSSGLLTGVRAGSTSVTAAWTGHQNSAPATVVSLSFTDIRAKWQTCGLTPGGDAYCWGTGWSGELGTGKLGVALTPTKVVGGHTFKALSLFYNYSCGLDTTGAAYCWGLNATQGNTCTNISPGTCSATPVALAGGLVFTALSAGGWHTCGLTSGGAAYCWTLPQDWSKSPAAVPGGFSFTSISSGEAHTCALVATGAAYCWGLNYYGELGTGDTVTSLVNPRAVAGGLAFATLSVGDSHTCGLTSNGAMYCWGTPNSGSTSLTPTQWFNGLTLVSLSSGPFGTCGLDAAGTMYCTNGGTAVPGAPAFQRLSIGYSYTCGVTVNQVGYCWGRNDSGQLGVGTATNYEANPIKVAGQP